MMAGAFEEGRFAHAVLGCGSEAQGSWAVQAALRISLMLRPKATIKN